MKSKYSILRTGKHTHIVCRPNVFREGDCVMAVDGSSVTKLDKSSSGELGEAMGGMFFAINFKAYPRRYVKIAHSDADDFQNFASRMVLVEKSLPKCSQEFTVLLELC